MGNSAAEGHEYMGSKKKKKYWSLMPSSGRFT